MSVCQPENPSTGEPRLVCHPKDPGYFVIWRAQVSFSSGRPRLLCHPEDLNWIVIRRTQIILSDRGPRLVCQL